LIVTNCAIVARAEIFASRNSIGISIADGLGMGAGFAGLLMALGAFRELVGHASIAGYSFAEQGFLLAILPPGAFFALALAVALKNRIDRKPGR
jgi:electron transport complex protein RnfE